MSEFKRPETVKDILDDPHMYGLPTLQEYKANERFYDEKWYGRHDDKFAFADRGSKLLNKYVQKHIYDVCGYRCATLEEAEKVALGEGIALQDLDYEVEVLPGVGKKCILLVRFMRKQDVRSRADYLSGDKGDAS